MPDETVDRSSPAIPDAWAGLSSAVVSDACDRAGLRDQTTDPSLRRQSGPRATLIGWARTARSIQRAANDDRPYAGEIALVDGLAPDDVAVASVDGVAAAFWGELFSAAAIGRGARGLVVDGPVRDLDRIQDLDFPVFATGTRPTDCHGRIAVVERDGEIVVGGVTVRSGDLVVADSDGVVVVPRGHVDEVLDVALAKARIESEAKQLLLRGGTLGEVWARHGVL